MILDFFDSWQQYQNLVKILVSQGPSISSGMSFWYVQKLHFTIWSHFVNVLEGAILYNLYYIYSARMLTWWLFYVRYRESAQPVVTDGITVTPTSPARWTRKTSAVSSVTVVTSFSGCTCGSTSCCDGQQPHVLHFPHCLHGPPASLALPYRQRPQSSRRQENDHLTQLLFSTCPIKNI